jgi:hypothetical protein
MKTRKILSWLGAATLLLGLFTPFSALAQQETPQQQPPSPSAQSPAPNAGQSEQQVQTFTGRIAKSKGNFVLKDQASNTAYQLDNADQAKQFVGKNVKVTGSLDPSTNMIHVSNIEVASASY